MSDVWNQVRAAWDKCQLEVDSGQISGLTSLAVPTSEAGAPSLAVNPIAVTGIAGAGKSVFYNALVQGIHSGDLDSSRSQQVEKHMIRLGPGRRRKRASLAVIPGQDSLERTKAIRDTMRGTASPHGLIHLTCWGHNRIWQRGDKREVAEQLAAGGESLSTDAVRQWHLNKELLDFRQLVDDLVEGQVATRLRWIVVAVSKVDLYWDRLAQARDYYIPSDTGAVSPFAELLKDLDSETELRLAVLPMASRIIRHEFLPSLPRITSQLDDAQLGILRAAFSGVLQEFVSAAPEGRS